MYKVSGRLQVFFEEPFWVEIFERIDNDKLSVCKITFGAEPKDYEVQAFILENYHKLRFSPSVDSIVEEKERINPKRLQREVKKKIKNVVIGSKSQQALKIQQEQGKLERKAYSREQNEAKKEFQYKLKQQKRREKHKGR
ncbi:MAG: YjdF family protein [Sedimentibacter sp.]